MSPELIWIEMARLVETSTAWEVRFRRYDRLIDSGLSCEEAAQIVAQSEADALLMLAARAETERQAA
ncbi:hypothetical protein [Mesorhizobium sp. M4B.F.Ca.ET.143.01.1.1]|uniref:hypothetical protein n=1 Tax=Mesorhizobium sp. M4B.F.Ca.ET.143.01.1.1 TaxID=2563947 RepID=UPI001093425F|nr:hypothetical protein [Mesorhizobium sp. M4B.F.Ca.ET.143.01.1.1]TGV26363.1 hypothetical protein EN786_12645 [Mesorhizobium sp. M4B.F.Ca.ET.143.01.1.1]